MALEFQQGHTQLSVRYAARNGAARRLSFTAFVGRGLALKTCVARSLAFGALPAIEHKDTGALDATLCKCGDGSGAVATTFGILL